MNNYQRLNATEAIHLFETANLPDLLSLANKINEQKNHKKVYYNINRHINPSNICSHKCNFCAFRRDETDTGAFTLSLEDIAKRANEAQKQGATEIHVTAGLSPHWTLADYKQILATIKKHAPKATIKAFTATEIAWLAKKNEKNVEAILFELRESGLESLTGGGAEIFDQSIRSIIAPEKISGEEWLNIHKIAHKANIKTTCTMLYGHIENYHHRVAHLIKLRDLQDETGGFLAFIPLKFQTWKLPGTNNFALNVTEPTTTSEDLKMMAMSRIILDNFANIKAYWVMLGKEVAKLSLSYGANDLDGTVEEEHIAHMANLKQGNTMSLGEIKEMIKSAGFIPTERTTHYQVINQE